jgi:hypothetical protein
LTGGSEAAYLRSPALIESHRAPLLAAFSHPIARFSENPTPVISLKQFATKMYRVPVVLILKTN